MLKRIVSGISAFIVSLSSLFVLAPTIARAAVDVCTWDGSSSLDWNTAANWTCATDGSAVPGTGDSLVFDNTGLSLSVMTLNNDITSGSFANITFAGTGSNYFTLSGNAFTLTGNISITTENGSASIDTPMIITGSKTLDFDGYISMGGNLSGSGSITNNGTGYLYLSGDNSSYAGTLTINGGSVGATAKGLAGTGGRVFNDGSTLYWTDCESTTLEGDITLNGASSRPEDSDEIPAIPKLYTSVGICGGGGGADEEYGSAVIPNTVATISGNVSLGSDVTFNSFNKVTKLTGAFTGGHKFVVKPGSAATILVESEDNSSSMPNGTYISETLQKTLTDSTDASIGIFGNTVVTVSGTRGTTTVSDGGTLKGTGTVGDLYVTVNSFLAPGNSPGCLSSSNFDLSGEYQVEIGGNDACTGYDQLKVTGTVTLKATTDGSTAGTIKASIVDSFKPVVGAKYTIISNDGADAVVGTFNDLAEGATFKTESGTVLKVSYVGGDGNDVVLTVITVGTPDTGFGLLLNNPLGLLAATSLAAGAILVMSRRLKPATKRARR